MQVSHDGDGSYIAVGRASNAPRILQCLGSFAVGQQGTGLGNHHLEISKHLPAATCGRHQDKSGNRGYCYYREQLHGR